MSSKPWMPLYIADFLKKTTHLGAIETGAYILLIMDYWQNEKLPSDDRLLARIAKLTDREWKRLRPILQGFFYDGWRHERIDEELAHATDVSGKRAAAAATREATKRSRDLDQTEHGDGSNDPSIDHTLHTTQRKKVDAPNGAPSSVKVYAFESGAIRLNQKDFDLWRASFSNLDVAAELLAMTAWASEQRSWFNAVKGALAKKNQIAKERKETAAKQGDFKWKSGMEGIV